MRRRLATGAVLLAAAAAVALTSCAVPTQSAPSAIPSSKVPFNLLNPHPPTTTTTQPKPSSYASVKVFFVAAGSQLQAETRYVSPPATLDSILTALLQGPLVVEAAAGITTAIPSDVTVLSVTAPQDDVVTVNLNSAFGQITGINSELSVAQIVATVTAESGPATGVIFEIEGQRTNVPVANGSLVAGPVYPIQFF